MESLVINKDNLSMDDIDVFSSKTRVLLFDEENRVLVGNYGGTYLLPGGKIDKNESVVSALIRELREETGTYYAENELDYLMCLEHYQKDYPNRSGRICNRLVRTYFFVGNYKSINNKCFLSDDEKKGGFSLELIPYGQLESVVVNSGCDNPRSSFFQDELLAVLSIYTPRVSGDGEKVLKYN